MESQVPCVVGRMVALSEEHKAAYPQFAPLLDEDCDFDFYDIENNETVAMETTEDHEIVFHEGGVMVMNKTFSVLATGSIYDVQWPLGNMGMDLGNIFNIFKRNSGGPNGDSLRSTPGPIPELWIDCDGYPYLFQPEPMMPMPMQNPAESQSEGPKPEADADAEARGRGA